MKILLLNGGKGCGKSSLVKYLMGNLRDYTFNNVSCKVPLYAAADVFYNLSEDDSLLFHDEVLKEIPTPVFRVSIEEQGNGEFLKLLDLYNPDKETEREHVFDLSNNVLTLNLSPREALIYLSEYVLKPVFGTKVFGTRRLNYLESHSSFLNFDDSSSAFLDSSGKLQYDELIPLLDYCKTNKIPKENVLLLQVKGRGDFNNDSRRFIPEGAVSNTVIIENTGTEEEYLTKCLNVVKDWLSKIENS